MTDPLLTIEDATREFRVSPKTIRRRLSSGEIEGAYKRPGNRGPEWVMPRQSLSAAGFVPRAAASPAALPTDPAERASYWERRAVDAEAALGSTRARGRGERRQDLGRLGWAFLGVSLLIAMVAGLVVLDGDEEPGPDAAPVTTGAMPMVVELLDGRTEPGDAIGLVGERRTDAIPAGRVAAASPRAGWEMLDGPRFVVATFDDDGPPPPVVALRDSAELLLRAPHAGMVVEVYDRRAPARDDTSEVAGPAPGTPDSLVTEGPTTPTEDPTTTIEGLTNSIEGSGTDAGEQAGDGEPPPATTAPSTAPEMGPIGPTTEPSPPPFPAAAPDPGGEPGGEAVPDPGPPAPERAPGAAQVAAGESFWSIAEDVVATELGPDAPDTAVTSYWSTLVSANHDRLVEPGNPDLLHIGQTIVLPPVT